MKTSLLIPVFLIFSFFISCNQTADQSDSAKADPGQPASQGTESRQIPDNEKQQIPVGKFSPPATDSIVSPVQPGIAANPDWDSKIIKTASVTLEIKDFKKYNDFVHLAVKQHGAYVAQEQQSLDKDKSETLITIKVPVAQFETLMNALPGDDGKVQEKRINTDDVTGEVVDTRSRLEAKKLMRLKYLEFLKQAKNMEEVLQVQNEINDIQVEIESAASRVSFLSQQAAYSTINLTFYQPLNGYQPADDTPSFLTRITVAFKTGMAWMTDLLVGLISIWPLLLIPVGAYMGWKMTRQPKLVVQKIQVPGQSGKPPGEPER